MSTVAPEDPTSGVKPEVKQAPDMPPPHAPRELERDSFEIRSFNVADQVWVAWISGKAAGGTGAYGLGVFDALHFATGDCPQRPIREALIPRGAFTGLFDEELRVLWAAARPIVSGDTPRPEPRSERDPADPYE
jgi:hypothetical protein